MNIFCVIPSYLGIQLETVLTIRALQQACWDHGHGFDLDGVPNRSMPLDLARAECMLKARRSKADAVLWLDDDVQLPALDFVKKMIPVLSAERPIISGVYRMRSDELRFTVMPLASDKIELAKVAGIRLQPCSWTGFGMVLMKHAVLDKMHESFPRLQYRSRITPDQTACGVFQSAIIDGDYVLDDRIFFARAAKIGIPVWAAVDIETIHDRYVGNYGKTLDALMVASSKTEKVA